LLLHLLNYRDFMSKINKSAKQEIYVKGQIWMHFWIPCVYLSILFLALQLVGIKLLSFEIVIFHTFESLSDKYRSQEVASNKLEKAPYRDCDIGFSHVWHIIRVLEKIFKDLAFFQSFWLLFLEYLEFQNSLNKI
jgi:hypothetical protein